MSERDDTWKALQADIREMWVIGRSGISAETKEDTDNLLRVLGQHPHLAQVFAHQPDPEVEAIKQMMLAHINAPVAPSDAQADAPRSSQRETRLPPNPLLAQAAVRQYRQACENNKLAPRTIAEREALVTKLISHVALAKVESETSLYVHDIGTHHIASLLDSMANKSATDGESTEEAASPRTLLKKISNLRAFFDWCREEQQATVIDPAAGLEKRDKLLRKAASKEARHYQPFEERHLRAIFEPKKYLQANRDPDYFWAPLLSLHLGMRLKEIVTLELQAIGQDVANGLWFIEVMADKAKNGNSARRLPVSERLLELGFVDYLEKLRTLGATRLFPHRDFTTKTMQRDPSKDCSRHFGDYLNSIDIRDDALVFHSFRHTVVTALHDHGTPPGDAMQIVGHQAQEHAVRTGSMSAAAAQSVHFDTYMHTDKARLGVDHPLLRLKKHLDRSIVAPLDYARLQKAAAIVSEHLVKASDGFKGGWSSLRRDYTAEQLTRLDSR